jgi:hypothetical protein
MVRPAFRGFDIFPVSTSVANVGTSVQTAGLHEDTGLFRCRKNVCLGLFCVAGMKFA